MTDSKDMEWMLDIAKIRSQVEAMPIEQRVLRLERYLETHHSSHQICNSVLEIQSNRLDELEEKHYGQAHKNSPEADQR